MRAYPVTLPQFMFSRVPQDSSTRDRIIVTDRRRRGTVVNLLGHTRGSVALMTGLMLPVMVMTVAMGVEVTSWSETTVDLQRVADVSAWAGAQQLGANNTPQKSTNVAADLAEINGISGASSRTWNSTSSTTTDNLITAQVVVGVRNTADTAMKVTVQRNIAKTFSLIFPSTQSSVTAFATATAELAGSPQPCLLALAGDGSGVTAGTDETFSGSADVTASDCSVRSDAGISLSGSSTLNVDGTYAGGTITTSGSSSITGPTYQNAGQISDPYASYAPLQSVISELSSGGTSVNLGGTSTSTIGPGTYSGLSVGASANLTLNAGLYIVNGNVSFAGSSTVTGNNVTIISSGSLAVGGSAAVSLMAPTTSATTGGVPGILFASKSSLASSFSGSASFPFAGVIYYPNGTITFGGSSTGGTGGCTEVIASKIAISGSSNLSAHCSAYGTLTFGSVPGGSIALVQ